MRSTHKVVPRHEVEVVDRDEDVVAEVAVVVMVVVEDAVAAVVLLENKIPLLLDRGRRKINPAGRTIIVDSRGRRRSRTEVACLGDLFG